MIVYLGDSLSINLHYGSGDRLRAVLQAPVLSLQTAHVHWVQKHLLTILSYRYKIEK